MKDPEQLRLRWERGHHRTSWNGTTQTAERMPEGGVSWAATGHWPLTLSVATNERGSCRRSFCSGGRNHSAYMRMKIVIIITIIIIINNNNRLEDFQLTTTTPVSFTRFELLCKKIKNKKSTLEVRPLHYREWEAGCKGLQISLALFHPAKIPVDSTFSFLKATEKKRNDYLIGHLVQKIFFKKRNFLQVVS